MFYCSSRIFFLLCKELATGSCKDHKTSYSSTVRPGYSDSEHVLLLHLGSHHQGPPQSESGCHVKNLYLPAYAQIHHWTKDIPDKIFLMETSSRYFIIFFPYVDV